MFSKYRRHKVPIHSIIRQTTEIPSQESKVNTESSIRPLFISLYLFNGIPSDIMHANIISYLPSKDYTKSPVVCKHFRNIMLNNPFIYNEKRYRVVVDHWNNKLYNSPETIKFNHVNREILINDYDKTKHDQLSLTKSKVPIYQIKHWVYYNISSTSKQETLSTPSSIIHKLTIDGQNIPNIEMFQQVLSEENNFKRCKIVLLKHSGTNRCPIIKNKSTFSKLQCLELSVYTMMPGMYVDKQFYKDLNSLLSNTPSTLRCLVLKLAQDYGRLMNRMTSSDSTMITIPQNVEWFKMDNENRMHGFKQQATILKIDITKCDKLIGIYLGHGYTNNNIIWPKKYIVPYVYFGWRPDMANLGVMPSDPKEF